MADKDLVKQAFVCQHHSLGGEHSESVKHVEGRDVMLNYLMKDKRLCCTFQFMDRKDPLFIFMLMVAQDVLRAYCASYDNNCD